MDTSRFSTIRDSFPVSDLVAVLSFETQTSVSFQLTRGPFWGKGWIDVHHPCDGHIKARLRVMISKEYLEFEKISAIVAAVFDALDIPRDETWEAEFAELQQNQIGIAQAINRDGYTDRLTS